MRWFVISLLVGIGLFFYFYDHKSGAYTAYLHFDRVRREGKCAELQAMVQGPAKTWADKYCAYGVGGDALAGAAAVMEGPDTAFDTAVMAGGLTSLQEAAGIATGHNSLSEDENEDGSITLVAESYPLDTHNDPSNRKLMQSKHRHRLRFKKQGEAYSVVEFSDMIVKD